MKHSWKAPHWAQQMSYRILPSRRRVSNLLSQIEAVSMGLEQTHDFIRGLIDAGGPFLVGRPGGTESEGLNFFMKNRIHAVDSNLMQYSESYRHLAQLGPGVAHQDESDLDFFHLKYLEATLASDVIGFGLFAPGALRIIDHLGKAGAKTTAIQNLEPFVALSQSITPWTASLVGKRVLVIHPFAESIQSQFAKRSEVTGVAQVLPDFDLQVLKPPVTFAGEMSARPWRSHFEQLVEETARLTFDIAIIGAGSYGLPIAHQIRRAGRQAIHLGGSLQLLFGIRGKRWDGVWPFSDFMDASWVRPSPAETPKNPQSVEGGVYW